jgi:hypothetical protein
MFTGRHPQIALPQQRVPIRASIETANGRYTNQKRTGMTKKPDSAAAEREEIAARIARFKETQEKFRREREEYFTITMANASQSHERRSF